MLLFYSYAAVKTQAFVFIMMNVTHPCKYHLPLGNIPQHSQYMYRHHRIDCRIVHILETDKI